MTTTPMIDPPDAGVDVLADSERRILGAPPSMRLEGWAIVEIAGHLRLGGYVAVVEVNRSTWVRVDVPETPNGRPESHYFQPRFVFRVRPVSESMARQVAAEEAEDPANREF